MYETTFKAVIKYDVVELR